MARVDAVVGAEALVARERAVAAGAVATAARAARAELAELVAC